MLALVINK